MKTDFYRDQAVRVGAAGLFLTVMAALPVAGGVLATYGTTAYSVGCQGSTGCGVFSVTLTGKMAIGTPQMGMPLPAGVVPVQVAVEPTPGFPPSPWILTSTGTLFKYVQVAGKKPSWAQQPGEATELSGGPDGSIWVVGTGTTADKAVYRWNGTGWDKMPQGSAVRLAVTPYGFPELITSANQHLQINPLQQGFWKQGSALIRELSIGSSGTRVALDPTNTGTAAQPNYAVLLWASYPAGAPAEWHTTAFSAPLTVSAIAVNDETAMLVVQTSGPKSAVESIPLSSLKIMQ